MISTCWTTIAPCCTGSIVLHQVASWVWHPFHRYRNMKVVPLLRKVAFPQLPASLAAFSDLDISPQPLNHSQVSVVVQPPVVSNQPSETAVVSAARAARYVVGHQNNQASLREGRCWCTRLHFDIPQSRQAMRSPQKRSRTPSSFTFVHEIHRHQTGPSSRSRRALIR
jgi:hypothetical protein